MKHALMIILLLVCSVAEAKHITGGEMIYDYLGPGSTSNLKRYRITLYLFRDQNCSLTGTCAPMPASVIIGIFNNGTNQQVGGGYTVSNSSTLGLPINPLPPCITSAPDLSYTVGIYTFVVELADNSTGYTAAYQTCCRIDGISNIGNSVGATYVTRIPGMTSRPDDFTDSSPRFAQGISVVCYDRPFTLDFSATDPDDRDSLVYSFCDAYGVGSTVSNANPVNPAPPPYSFVQYNNGFFGGLPLGSQAFINPQTGIISGIAPDAGRYVVSVCVRSFRDGVYISEHRKDFIITVAPCDLSGAQLLPSYLSCDGSTFVFENQNASPLNLTYFWDFGDGNTSTDISPTNTYLLAGVYTVKLVVNKGLDCSDSASSILRVFPGYYPDFDHNAPMCKGIPVSFSDQTEADYGTVNSWQWDFGDLTSDNDVSNLKNPSFVYNAPGLYNVVLVVSSDVGCTGVFRDTVRIVEKPLFTVTNDTLICSIDTLQLNAAGPGGSVTWSPNYNISSLTSFNPQVWPKVTTTYVATYSDNFGCSASETVLVQVVDTVTLQGMKDTTICTTDSVLLQVNSNALHYTWTPPESLNDPSIKNPIATPDGLTLYTVKGRIGKCETTDYINILTVPYPNVRTSPDTSVCFGTNASLRASGGSIYNWTPSVYLNATNIPNPVAILPRLSVDYKVSVSDTLGCPKPVTKTVKLGVVKIVADAGPQDTSVVLGQPLQLMATGSLFYSWHPPIWLNNAFIPDPLAFPKDNIRYTVRVSDDGGCFGTDSINVKLYRIEPDLLVPSAFTPNGDGVNDRFTPIPIGMRSLDAFRVYNRWGQLLFSTTQQGFGWDGTFGGRGQDAGTYVWYAEGVDYKNKKIQRKGYVVLIR